MYGLENMLSSFTFRGFLVISGIFGIVFAGGIAIWIAARSFGKGRRLHVDRTPFPRTMFQLALFWVFIGGSAAFIGVIGPRFVGMAWEALGLGALVGVVLWCWHWVEHEFARPGWFVPVEAKDEPGRFFVRREARRREEAELAALGERMLKREEDLRSRRGESDDGHDCGGNKSDAFSSGDERE